MTEDPVGLMEYCRANLIARLALFYHERQLTMGLLFAPARLSSNLHTHIQDKLPGIHEWDCDL